MHPFRPSWVINLMHIHVMTAENADNKCNIVSANLSQIGSAKEQDVKIVDV